MAQERPSLPISLSDETVERLADALAARLLPALQRRQRAPVRVKATDSDEATLRAMGLRKKPRA